MANTFITPDVVAKRALAGLYANAVMPQLVVRDYDNEFTAAVGDTVNVRVPASFTADEFAGSTSAQNITESSVPVVLDKHYDVTVEVTAKQWALEVNDFNEQVIQPAMEAIVEKVDTLLISTIAATSQAVTGFASGTAVTSILEARRQLNVAKAPLTQRYGVWTSDHDAVLNGVALFHQADQRGDTEGLREANLGRKFGFDHFTDVNADSGAKSILFHKNAAALAVRPLEVPRGAEGTVLNYKGLAIRVVFGYTMSSKVSTVSFDMLCGAKLLRASQAVSIAD